MGDECREVTRVLGLLGYRYLCPCEDRIDGPCESIVLAWVRAALAAAHN